MSNQNGWVLYSKFLDAYLAVVGEDEELVVVKEPWPASVTEKKPRARTAFGVTWEAVPA